LRHGTLAPTSRRGFILRSARISTRGGCRRAAWWTSGASLDHLVGGRPPGGVRRGCDSWENLRNLL